jgi:hypothetical protein
MLSDFDDLGAGIPRGGPARCDPHARAAAEERAGGRCEMPWCRAEVFLVLHHLTYRRAAPYGSGRVGNELSCDVVMVCQSCHDDFHLTPRGRIGDPELAAYIQATFPNDKPWPSRFERDQPCWITTSYHHPDGPVFVPGHSEPPAEPW